MRTKKLITGSLFGLGLVFGTLAGAGAADAEDVHNYPAKVDLNGRQNIGEPADAPGAKVDIYHAGDQVPVECQQEHAGEIWNFTADDVWVPDKYITTGYDSFTPGVPKCDGGDDGGASEVHGRNDGPAGPTDGTVDEKVARVVDAATSQTGQGYSYSWGAGGKGGASYGIADPSPSGYNDYDRFGYDCSGLTLYAYWKGAGIDIGANTESQVEAGTAVPIADAKPGDLLFKSENGVTVHVAIVTGDGKLVEATWPRDENSVHEVAYNPADWDPQAIRIIQ